MRNDKVGEATGGYIAHAVGLLHEKPSHGPSVTHGLFEGPGSAADGCTGTVYVLLIKCLCTGAVRGLRTVPVDEGPWICSLPETPARTTCRSLSCRQVGVLKMIARGMPNKCIARSLGIAPETVKTHAKAILRKLEARTRAQAVARAKAIGLL